LPVVVEPLTLPPPAVTLLVIEPVVLEGPGWRSTILQFLFWVWAAVSELDDELEDEELVCAATLPSASPVTKAAPANIFASSDIVGLHGKTLAGRMARPKTR
jgi:hypothetical protein